MAGNLTGDLYSRSLVQRPTLWVTCPSANVNVYLVTFMFLSTMWLNVLVWRRRRHVVLLVTVSISEIWEMSVTLEWEELTIATHWIHLACTSTQQHLTITYVTYFYTTAWRQCSAFVVLHWYHQFCDRKGIQIISNCCTVLIWGTPPTGITQAGFYRMDARDLWRSTKFQEIRHWREDGSVLLTDQQFWRGEGNSLHWLQPELITHCHHL